MKGYVYVYDKMQVMYKFMNQVKTKKLYRRRS